jgi:hypothetical protein
MCWRIDRGIVIGAATPRFVASSSAFDLLQYTALHNDTSSRLASKRGAARRRLRLNAEAPRICLLFSQLSPQASSFEARSFQACNPKEQSAV